MNSDPLTKIQEARTHATSPTSIARSTRAFGIRASPADAGALRKHLQVQPTRQFQWNAALNITQHYIVRGLPASYTDIEITTTLYEGFQWAQVPLRRTKTNSLGAACWLIGAENPPDQLHARLGAHLVTIEIAKHRQRKAQPKRQHAPQLSKWDSSHQAEPADDMVDAWAAARPSSSQGSWWSTPSSGHTDHNPWGSYRGANADGSQHITTLEKRMDKIEASAAEQSQQLSDVDNRVGKVETDISGLAAKMQQNFDRIFDVFEQKSRMRSPSSTRKHQRKDDFRGGAITARAPWRSLRASLVGALVATAWAQPASRGGSLSMVQEVDYQDLVDAEHCPEVKSLAFCNPSRHRGHMHRLMDSNLGLDLLVIGESNHMASDMQPTKSLPLANDGYQILHQAWTPPVRVPGDHQTPGRPSAGIAFASLMPLSSHPFTSDRLNDMAQMGRCLLQRVELQPALWLNIFGVYAPAPTWQTSASDTVTFLSNLATEVLTAPNELNLVLGDFNLQCADDPIAQALMARSMLIDVGAACADCGCPQPPTYRSKSSSSAIDRALCSPDLLRWISAFKIPKPDGPLSPLVVTHWQTANAHNFAKFMTAFESKDVEAAYYTWASTWENYLQVVSQEDLNWEPYTGRATACVRMKPKSPTRMATQMQSDAERTLWRLLGLLQRHRQTPGAHTPKNKSVAERLHKQVLRQRSLPTLDWASDHACIALEEATRHAIHAERLRRITQRRALWKAELNASNARNFLARRMVRGASPKLLILEYQGRPCACPALQVEILDNHWARLAGYAIVRHPFHPPPITAAHLRTQLQATRRRAAHGPDWWRVAELQSLPDAALSMLAAALNLMESVGVMPRTLMQGWNYPIAKTTHVADPGSVRPITVLSAVHRLWSGARYQALQTWSDCVLHASQSAFRSGRSARKEVTQILGQLNARIESSRAVCVGSIDLSKAFPTINREKAASMLFATGLPVIFTDFIATSCLEKTIRWKQSGVLSAGTPTHRGTPQGCALSIMTFQVLVAPAIRATQRFLHRQCTCSAIYAYADDIIILASTPSLLQSSMQYLADLLGSLDFSVNPLKSLVCTMGTAPMSEIYLGATRLPVAHNLDVFGCTLAAGHGRLTS
eukprot:5278823-Amphidinium_carterae.2